MSLAMASQEKPRVKRKRDGGDEKSDADGRHAGDLVEDVQHDNLAGRVVQPVEGDGRTNAGSGRQLRKKPTVPASNVVETMQHCVRFLLRRLLPQQLLLHGLRPPRVRHAPAAHL